MERCAQSGNASEKNKEIALRIIDEVWNKKNAAIIDEIISADYIMNHPAGVLQGSDEYKRNYATYIKAFPDFQVTVNGEMVAEGDQVAFAFTMQATHAGELMGIAATGSRVTTKGMIIFRFANGRAVEERSIWDTLSLMKGIGMVVETSP